MPTAILHVLGTAELEGSGIARIVAILAAELDRDKYELHAWFLGPAGPLIEEMRAAGANVRSINWRRGFRDPVGAYRFWRSLRYREFAIVHQHYGARSVRCLISLFSRARLIVHLHGHVSGSVAKDRASPAMWGADLVIAASHAIAREVPALSPVVVHAGVRTPTEFRHHQNTSRTMIVIGAACRLVPAKGLTDLVRAMALLGPEFSSVRLEVAGAGPACEDLKAEINQLGLTHSVEFLGWKRNLGPVLRNWDAFIMPSHEEGFGLSALEAMAEGLPVLATSVGGLPEIVEHCQTGYLVPASDIAALAEGLRYLIVNPERRHIMGNAGRERVRHHFTVDRMVTQIATIYESLLLRPNK